MTAGRRTAALLLGAVAFGVLAGAIKGDSSGLRSDIGNVSAPWLLVGLLPAARSRSIGRGALMGMACSLAALFGFYATLTVVLNGHLGGGGYLHELSVELHANRIYLLAGVVSGPICGAAGAVVGRRRSGWLWLLAGALLVGEMAAVAAFNDRQLLPAPLYFAWTVTDWAVYTVEAAIGVTIAVAAAWSLRPRASRAP
jgi:hypothetical protein